MNPSLFASAAPRPLADLPPDCITARGTAFLFDIDGTLLDIAPTPSAVVVPHVLIEALASLTHSTNGAVALVSGRPLAEIDRLFAPLSLPAIGGHGAETRARPDETGCRLAPALPLALRHELSSLHRNGVIVEDKEYSVAVHYRLAPEQAPELARVIERLLQQSGAALQVMAGKAVFEIKPPSLSKGRAVLELMKTPPFAGRRPVYFGDDETDRTVFSVLGTLGGIGVAVGSGMPPAQFVCDSPAATRHWIEKAAHAISRPEPPSLHCT